MKARPRGISNYAMVRNCVTPIDPLKSLLFHARRITQPFYFLRLSKWTKRVPVTMRMVKKVSRRDVNVARRRQKQKTLIDANVSYTFCFSHDNYLKQQTNCSN